MPRLALSLFGTFQASADERPITNFPTDKVRALLAYLTVEADRPHRRDTLAALLWPNWDNRGARNNLRLALHRLRESLDAADPFISQDLFGVTRETVQVHSTAVAVDVARFVTLLEMCETHPHRLLHLCPSCLEHLGEAATLYSGELLAGLSIADAPAFEQWELSRREEMTQRVLNLLNRLADAFELLGELSRALIFAQRQLAIDPYREEAHRQVIRCYARQGERAAALAHYDRARRLLADELGVAPDPATVELAAQVRAGKLEATNGHAAGRPLLHHFPARFTPFFGRAAEIARLVERLAQPDARLMTVVAPGGMGKTRLGIAVAEAVGGLPGFGDGIYFVSLAKTPAAELLPSALAEALNVNLGSAANPARQLAAVLRPMRALLVLDNFEHMLDGVDLLLELLQDAPGVKMLVTSREALNVRGEERFVLGGLEDEAAMTLFVSAAARMLPGYAPGPADREAIRAVARTVGGMPLAVELAATWMRMMDAPAIAARIRADIDFLSTTLRDLPPRQRSMRAIFDYMWQTLLPPERLALASLSVLRGPFRLDAAEAISGASSGVLALLLDQSLLRVAGGGRFEMHELLRQYAAAQLAAEAPLAAEAHARHAAHYLGLLKARGALLGGPRSKEALAALLRNVDNVRAAWGWAVSGGHLSEIEQAAPSLQAFYRHSGLSAEGAETLATAAGTLESLIEQDSVAPSAARPIIFELMRHEALLLELHGAGAAALARLEQARAGWEALGNRRQVVRVLCEVGYVGLRHFGDFNERAMLEDVLVMAREVDDNGLIAAALHNLGNAWSWQGDIAHGRRLLEESLEYYRAAGQTSWLAGTLSDLAMTYAYEAEIAAAKALFRQSLAVSEESGDQPGIAMAMANLGGIALDSGDLAEAEAFSRRGQATAQDIGDQLMLSVSLGNQGHVALARGERAVAIRFYRDTATLTQQSGYNYMLIEAVLGLAALAAPGDPVAASRWVAAVAGWRRSTGFELETPYVRALRQATEERLEAALGGRGALDDDPPLSIDTAAAEATAWAMEQVVIA